MTSLSTKQMNMIKKISIAGLAFVFTPGAVRFLSPGGPPALKNFFAFVDPDGVPLNFFDLIGKMRSILNFNNCGYLYEYIVLGLWVTYFFLYLNLVNTKPEEKTAKAHIPIGYTAICMYVLVILIRIFGEDAFPCRIFATPDVNGDVTNNSCNGNQNNTKYAYFLYGFPLETLCIVTSMILFIIDICTINKIEDIPYALYVISYSILALGVVVIPVLRLFIFKDIPDPNWGKYLGFSIFYIILWVIILLCVHFGYKLWKECDKINPPDTEDTKY